MRVFQNSGLYPTYRRRLDGLAAHATRFRERLDVFIADRFGAPHFLQPVLSGDADAFFTNGDDDVLQSMWAREHGLPSSASLDDIVLAQIEEHRAEVFYDLDPMKHPPTFLRRLPSCVRRRVAWRAAPSPGANFSGFDLMVCNFPGILRSFQAAGLRAEYFCPAHDPQMDSYAAATSRDVDVMFIGGYTRHHRRRAALLEAVAALGRTRVVAFHLDVSRLTRLADTPLGLLPPLARHRRPSSIRRAAHPPLFGRDLYRAIASAKIVLNGAIDMAGEDRGNMRCFEAMGCGALLLSDEGRYPEGMMPGVSLVTYSDPADAVRQVERLLADHVERERIAGAGRQVVSQTYSKERQWARFVELVG